METGLLLPQTGRDNWGTNLKWTVPQGHISHLQAPKVQQSEDQCITSGTDSEGAETGTAATPPVTPQRAAVSKGRCYSQNKNGEEEMKQVRVQQLHRNSWVRSPSSAQLGPASSTQWNNLHLPLAQLSPNYSTALSDSQHTRTGCCQESSTWLCSISAPGGTGFPKKPVLSHHVLRQAAHTDPWAKQGEQP